MFSRVLVTNRGALSGVPFARAVVAQAVKHGATLIVLREKDLEAAALLPMAEELGSRSPIPVVVSHLPEVARAAGAAGVHLGWSSTSIKEARSSMNADALVGVSVHDVEEGVERASEGADYLFLGPVNTTPKPRTAPPIGFEPIRQLASRVRIPVVAIGGLGFDDLARVREAGAAGLAAIRAFANP